MNGGDAWPWLFWLEVFVAILDFEGAAFCAAWLSKDELGNRGWMALLRSIGRGLTSQVWYIALPKYVSREAQSPL